MMNRSCKRHWLNGFLVAATWTVVAALAAEAQPEPAVTTVQVVGGSAVSGGNPTAGREAAIESGLAAAVHQVLAGIIPPETIAANFQALNKAVFSRTDQFVNDYKVIAESRNDKSYRLLLEAGISADRLRQALKSSDIRVGLSGYPRLLLCLAEKKVDDAALNAWWSGQRQRQGLAATAMSQVLAGGHFPMIEPDTSSAAGNYPPELSASEAIALGRLLGAEVVVTGLALAEEIPPIAGGTTPSVRGTLTVQAYRISDGQSIAQARQSALSLVQESDRAQQEALQAAASSTAQDLVRQLQAVWFKDRAAKEDLQIVVEGTSGHIANFVKFRGALGTLPGVDSVQVKEMTVDAAHLMVAYEGTARALADSLLSHRFDAFEIDITQVDDAGIRLRLVAR